MAAARPKPPASRRSVPAVPASCVPASAIGALSVELASPAGIKHLPASGYRFAAENAINYNISCRHDCTGAGEGQSASSRGPALPAEATSPELSIVLPAHNEADNIEPMRAALEKLLAPSLRYEIVFVDDGSSDGTLAAIRAAAARYPAVRYLSSTRNVGHHPAVRA